MHGRYYPVAPALAPSFFTWFWLLDDCCHGHFTKRQKDTSTLISNFFLTLHGHDNVWVHLSVHPFVVETLCYMYNTRRFGLLVYWSIHPLTCESIDTKHLKWMQFTCTTMILVLQILLKRITEHTFGFPPLKTGKHCPYVFKDGSNGKDAQPGKSGT